MRRWRWQRALVTGASAGLGAEAVRQLAAAGVATVVVARRADRLETLATEVRERGGDVEVLPADLTQPKERARVEQRLADADRPIDLLVNNAGLGAYGHFVKLDRDDQQDQIDVNVTALMRLAHAALPGMIARGHGAVLNVSSAAAFQPQPYGAVYAATKAFVNSLSHALAEETRGTGVTVTALCPGFTHTEFQTVSGADSAAIPEALWSRPADVVRVGLQAAARGRSVAVPGWPFRALAAVASVTPARVSRRIVARQTAQRLPGV